MTTDTKQTPTSLAVHRPEQKVDMERHFVAIEAQVNPALTFAAAWASAIASLSATVVAQTQLVTSAAARQMLGSWVSRPLQPQFDHERPSAQGATAHAQDQTPTGPGPLGAEVFDEVLELLVEVDIADSI